MKTALAAGVGVLVGIGATVAVVAWYFKDSFKF